MTEEFNLSSKIKRGISIIGDDEMKKYWIKLDNVKEFIKRLKEEVWSYTSYELQDELRRKIDKLAGDKLS